MARRAPYWSCRCGHRNLREHRKCRGCEKPKPKKRVPKHAEVLRDTPYEEYARLSVLIHGGELDHCAVCKKAPTKTRRFDRDHDHRLGIARGIACSFCNRERLRGIAERHDPSSAPARAVGARRPLVDALVRRVEGRCGGDPLARDPAR